eukprot:1055342-Prymnesium_polylepis.1
MALCERSLWEKCCACLGEEKQNRDSEYMRPYMSPSVPSAETPTEPPPPYGRAPSLEMVGGGNQDHGDDSEEDDEPEQNAPMPLSQAEIESRIDSCPTTVHRMGDAGYRLRYSSLSQRGYYPDELTKANQDAYKIVPSFNGDPQQFFMGVFDGHGVHGDYCAVYVREQIERSLIEEMEMRPEDFTRAYKETFERINKGLHSTPIDDTLSGST